MLYYLLLLLDTRVLLVFLCVFLVTFAYVKSCKPAGFPPGPPALPFIGNLNLLANDSHLHKTLFALGRKYGPMYSLQLGWYPAVVINDSDVLREALVKKGNQCSDRSSHIFFMKLSKAETSGVVMSDGEIWKAGRKLCVGALRDFGVGTATIEDKVLQEADNIVLEIAKHKGKPFTFGALLRKASANVVCAMLFGNRYSYEDEEFLNILRTVESFLTAGNVVQSPTLLIPFLYPFQLFRKNSRATTLAKMITAMKKQMIEHRQKFDKDNVKDFVDVFLEGKINSGNNEVFSDENCTRTILQLFIAGTDTTSGTLNWAMLFMLKHPEIQDKCRQDIFEVVGNTRKPSLKDRLNLPYVEATLFETLRLGSVAPHGVSHRTAGEVTLNGYTLPNDTVIIPDIYSIHMNPDLWKDPEEFRPERFIDTDGKITKPPHFVPFSIGRRACLGEQLARTELFLFFTTMLQNYKFSCEDAGALPTIHDAKMGLTLMPAQYSITAKQIK